MVFDEDSINAEYERRVKSVNELDERLEFTISRYISPPEDGSRNDGSACPDSDDAPPLLLQNNAMGHLNAALRVVEFALTDIISIAELERQAISNIAESSELIDSIQSHLHPQIAIGSNLAYIDTYIDIDIEMGGHKAIYNFLNELSTIVDNVYLMIGEHFGFQERGRGTRAKVARSLKGINPELAQYLQQHFYEAVIMMETQELRNRVSHEIPIYEIEVVRAPRGSPEDYRLGIFIPHESVSMRHEGELEMHRKLLFDYMFSAYAHILEGTAEVVKRLADIKPN